MLKKDVIKLIFYCSISVAQLILNPLPSAAFPDDRQSLRLLQKFIKVQWAGNGWQERDDLGPKTHWKGPLCRIDDPHRDFWDKAKPQWHDFLHLHVLGGNYQDDLVLWIWGGDLLYSKHESELRGRDLTPTQQELMLAIRAKMREWQRLGMWRHRLTLSNVDGFPLPSGDGADNARRGFMFNPFALISPDSDPAPNPGERERQRRRDRARRMRAALAGDNVAGGTFAGPTRRSNPALVGLNPANLALGFVGGFIGEELHQAGYGQAVAITGLTFSIAGGASAGYSNPGSLWTPWRAQNLGRGMGAVRGALTGVAAGLAGAAVAEGASYLGANNSQSELAGRLSGVASAGIGGPAGVAMYGFNVVAGDIGSIASSGRTYVANGGTWSGFASETFGNYGHYFNQMMPW